MLSSTVFAASGATNNTVLMCTSAGYVSVDLAKFDVSSGAFSISELTSSSNETLLDLAPLHAEHCPYCQLFDAPDGHQTNLLPYPAPSSNLALHYKSVLATRASQHLIQQRRLRAPPLFG